MKEQPEIHSTFAEFLANCAGLRDGADRGRCGFDHYCQHRGRGGFVGGHRRVDVGEPGRRAGETS